jgi:long-subunit fatty acid transport protein
MKKTFLILFLSFICVKTQGQKNPENQLGTWYMYNGSHKLSEKYALKTMAHFRYFEFASEFQQEIYRLGINYAFTPKTNITLGVSYASADTAYDTSSANLYESRFYEDLNLKSNWKKFTVKHRFRFEQRFIYKNLTKNQFQNWLRYSLNIRYPISTLWSAYLFNEIFLNLNSTERFDQNWAGAGFLYTWNRNIQLKMGYFQIKSPTLLLNRMQLGVIIHTDFTKKK